MPTDNKVTLKPCPFCGSVSSPRPEQDILTRCSNRSCAVYKTAFTHVEWNTRTPDVEGLVAALETLLNGLPVFPESDNLNTRISAHHLGLLTVGQIKDAKAALTAAKGRVSGS